MSRFFSDKYKELVPYVPGEQPKTRKYIKLNTNESPFPPSPRAVKMAAEAAESLELYSDPDCRDLVKKAAEHFGVKPSEVIMTNGSDEVLNFSFMAFCDAKHPAVFPDITYGFYPVFAQINNVPYEEIPLKDDFSIDIEDYVGINRNIYIANPNAPTGLLLTLEQIEKIVASNPDNIVVIDEAYIDFGGVSAVPLIKKYDNLLVTQTFSKSRSMAGARLGFGIADEKLINDLNTIKFSTNPYNINRMTGAAGIGALEDQEYTDKNCKEIIRTRTWFTAELRKLGFELNDSYSNFVFAKNPSYDGKKLYLDLKEKGILVRHFDKPRLCQYNRITIGTEEQMQTLLDTIKGLMEE